MDRIREKVVYQCRDGKIVEFEDMLFGGKIYRLFDANGSFVKILEVPFRVSDYFPNRKES